jgi:hypothetical protein
MLRTPSLGVPPDLRLVTLKVMDFGIGAHAQAAQKHTTGSQSLGRQFVGFRTPRYSSPQQSGGLPPHESDDVFAVGVIWYELLVGEMGNGPPLGRDWAVRREDLRSRGLTQPQLGVLEACLEPSREHRIHNAVELANDIKGAYEALGHTPSMAEALDEVLRRDQFCSGLDLPGLTTLSVEVAEALGRWLGSFLWLDGLSTISVEATEGLLTWSEDWNDGHALSFNGITSLSREVAEVLARWKGTYLVLDGLTGISIEVAKLLAKRKRTSVLEEGPRDLLSLNGLRTLTVGVAETLAGFEGTWLSLDGLTALSAEVADALSQWKGILLELNGLAGLTVNVAKALTISKGNHRHRLSLNGLTSLTANIAEQLASEAVDELSLNGLTSFPVDVAKKFTRWSGRTLKLDNLPSSVKAQLRACPGLLFTSAERGGLAMTNYLLSKVGADPNAGRRDGQTPLLLACKNHHWGIVKCLISAGAATDVSAQPAQNTPLHLAAMAGNAEIVELLLENGADFHKKNTEGRTPLQCAAVSRHAPTGLMLIRFAASADE